MEAYKHSKNKQHILDVAYRLFDKKGYHKTTMRDIATQSGGSLGAVTHYFRKKSDIAKLLYQNFGKSFYTQIKNIYSQLPLSTLERDTIYLCTAVRCNATMGKRNRFLHEVSQEGFLTDLMFDTIFMQFVRKNEYLHLHQDNQALLVHSLFYIGMYQQMVSGIHTGMIKDVEKAVYAFNVHHLKQLNVREDDIEPILNVTLPISYAIEISDRGLFDVTLRYPALET